MQVSGDTSDHQATHDEIRLQLLPGDQCSYTQGNSDKIFSL